MTEPQKLIPWRNYAWLPTRMHVLKFLTIGCFADRTPIAKIKERQKER